MSQLPTVSLLSVATLCTNLVAERVDQDSEEAVALRDLANDLSGWLAWAMENRPSAVPASPQSAVPSAPAAGPKRRKPWRLQAKPTRGDFDPNVNFGRF